MYYFFCDITYWTSTKMQCACKCVCVHLVVFYQLRTHVELIKCVKESIQRQKFLHCTINKYLLQGEADPKPVLNCNGQHDYDESTRSSVRYRCLWTVLIFQLKWS